MSQSNYGVALIDRLTTKAFNAKKASEDIDANRLKELFEKSLYDLYVLRREVTKKSLEVEHKCRIQEKKFRQQMAVQRIRMDEISERFVQLDTNIREASGKIVHLGDQLERKSSPRKHLEEARELILEFSKFLGAGGGTFANIANNAHSDQNQLIEAAIRIRNLNTLCLELPDDERFLGAKQRVTVACQNLEASLLNRFQYNFIGGNRELQKRIADVFVHSKNYAACTNTYIDEVLKSFAGDLGNLSGIPDLVVNAEQDINAIFQRPDAVLLQLIQTIFTQKLKIDLDKRTLPGVLCHCIHNNYRLRILDLVHSHTLRRHLSCSVALRMAYFTDDVCETSQNVPSSQSNAENYHVYRGRGLWSSVQTLVNQLSSRLHLVSDPVYLVKLQRDLFVGYLTNYIQREVDFLTNRLAKHLARFYDSFGHQKRILRTSGLSDLRREMQLRLHIGTLEGDVGDYARCLLSQEVAINILEDVRHVAKRCLLLSQPSELAENGKRLFFILVQYLISEHIDYGVTLALQGLQMMDPKMIDGKFIFFTVVHEGSSIYHFFEKSANESIAPLINGNFVCERDCSSKRRNVQIELEGKFNLGLDRCLSLSISHIQGILASEQKRSDFRPDHNAPPFESSGGLPSTSIACQKVVHFVNTLVKEVVRNLDGQNLHTFLSELGKRMHRTLMDHFYGFTFSDSGGFVAMQDVTAYREAARQFRSPVTDYLFDLLLKLMNIVLIKPANVRQVSQDYLQGGIPRDLIMNFIQLRTDCKSTKLQSEMMTELR